MKRRDRGGVLAALGAGTSHEQLWAIVLEEAPLGFAVLDPSLRYVHVNRFLADVNGVAAADHIGHVLRDIAPAVADVVEPVMRRVLDSGEPVTDLSLVRPAPTDSRHYQGSYHPVRDAEGAVVGVCAIVVDVTDRKRVAEGLAVQARRQTAVADLGQRALAHSGIDSLLADAVGVIERALAVDHVAVLEVVPGQSHLRLRAGAGWPPQLTTVDAGDGPAVNLFAFALAAAAPVAVGDLETDPVIAGAPVLTEQGLTSAAAVVIRAEQGPFGLLGAFARTSDRFDDNDLAFLQSVANIVGAAVEQRRSSEELRTTAEQLQVALHAGDLGYWDWDVETGRVTWSSTLATILGAPDPGEPRVIADYLAMVHPDDRSAAEATTRAAMDGTGDGVYEHRIVRTDGAVRWIHGVSHAQRDKHGRVARVLGLCADITERKNAERSRRAALTAERVARAEAEEAGRRLAFLAEATARMAASLDPPSTLEAVARLAVPVFADVCVVTLRADGQPPQLAVAARAGDTEALVRDLARRCVPGVTARGPLAAVERTGQPVLLRQVPSGTVQDLAVDDRHLAALRSLRITTGMCVPFSVRGQALGTITLARVDDAPPYTDTDLVLAEELARRAALAIDNARLFEEAQRTGERSRRLAETLQRSLLPPSLPSVPGFELAAAYHPAARQAGVGGDFYDVFPLGGGRWGVVVGDVCGKGPEAATLTALARYTLRTVALSEDAPHAALAALNEAVLREAGDTQYCTVAYAAVCPKSGELRIVCGGHPLPLVLRAAGTVEQVGAPGSLIGLLDAPEITERTVRLSPGDAIVFYTDGITDARRGQESFGEARLADALQAGAGSGADGIVRRLEERVLDFCEGKARDDIAMLVLRMADDSPPSDLGSLGWQQSTEPPSTPSRVEGDSTCRNPRHDVESSGRWPSPTESRWSR